MALIIDQNQLMRMSDGSKWKILGRVSFDNFYLTGGMYLPADILNLVQIDSFSITGNEQGFLYEYDYVNTKLKVFAGAGSASGTVNPATAGTPTGVNSAPIFSGVLMSTHNHSQAILFDAPQVVVANTVTISPGFSVMQNVYVTAGAVTGPFVIIPASGGPVPASGQVAVNPGINTLTFFAGDAVTSVLVTYLQDITFSSSAGIPSGTNSNPVFTGSLMAGHGHTFTGAGGGGGASEITNGTDLSFLTNVEFGVIGL